MKLKLLISLLSVVSLHGQVVLTASTAATSIRPGQSTTINLTLLGPTAVAGLQWTLTAPSSWVIGSQTLSAQVLAVPKSINCGISTCLLWGLNVTPIPTGLDVTATLTAPASASAGVQTLALSGLFAGSPAGVTVPITGVNATITVLSNFDINGDGQVTAADVNAVVAQVASGICANDVVGNGQCNILQIIAEVIGWAAVGSKP